MKKIGKGLFVGVSLLLFQGYVTSAYAEQQEVSSSKAPIYPHVGDLKLSSFYKLDTDGDGIIDLYDKEPNKWNISDRDLRFFMELAYRSEEELTDIFLKQNPTAIAQFNQNKLQSSADVSEVVKNWKFVGQLNRDNGFSVSFFANGQQVVVAFRGTDDRNDYDDDAKLFMALQPGQVKNLQEVFDTISQYDDYYLTGHSLGGYLAQYFAARDLMSNPKYQHSAIFNAPGIASSLFSGSEHRNTAKNKDKLVKIPYTFEADERQKLEEYKAQAYAIHGDVVAGYTYYANTQWLDYVSGPSKHSSSTFFANATNDIYRKYFSVGYRLDNPYLTIDTDGDGLADVDELKIGTKVDAMDSDSDGFGDYMELLMGSDPLDPTKRPLYNQIYTALPTKYLFVDKADEVTIETLKSVVYATPHVNYLNLDKQHPKHLNDEVQYDFLNLPTNWSKVPSQYRVNVKATFKDSSIAPDFAVTVVVKENAGKTWADVSEVSTPLLTVLQGEAVELSNQIAPLVGEKERHVVTEVSSQETGHFTGAVKVIFEDGSEKVFPVQVEILENKDSRINPEVVDTPAETRSDSSPSGSETATSITDDEVLPSSPSSVTPESEASSDSSPSDSETATSNTDDEVLPSFPSSVTPESEASSDSSPSDSETATSNTDEEVLPSSPSSVTPELEASSDSSPSDSETATSNTDDEVLPSSPSSVTPEAEASSDSSPSDSETATSITDDEVLPSSPSGSGTNDSGKNTHEGITPLFPTPNMVSGNSNVRLGGDVNDDLNVDSQVNTMSNHQNQPLSISAETSLLPSMGEKRENRIFAIFSFLLYAVISGLSKILPLKIGK